MIFICFVFQNLYIMCHYGDFDRFHPRGFTLFVVNLSFLRYIVQFLLQMSIGAIFLFVR